ncbi:thioredoxin domain-containing protein 12 [Lepeophtheirus salmonis]|uniref:thioredoxin domain-containing protein 12 n=1 Tax=Lepeophtheirus salmonis TaxID=72036 RepID=UPI001AE7F6D1|nr:thioredoxin domain-containing protein 12-like [Lepeophtheirus salmonis]
MKVLSLLLAVFAISTRCQEEEEGDLSGGWGNQISWISWSSQVRKDGKKVKPSMVLLHDPSCPACQRLKPLFASSEEIRDSSPHFHMIQTSKNEEPSSLSLFSPDGSYIPRILFLAPNGTLLKEIINPQANPSYQYFYYDPQDIVHSMKQVIDLFFTPQI